MSSSAGGRHASASDSRCKARARGESTASVPPAQPALPAAVPPGLRLRKCARHHQIRQRAHQVDHRFTVEMKIRLIHQHHRCGARCASSIICARVAIDPDGLLGLAMATILVRGVIALQAAAQRETANRRQPAPQPRAHRSPKHTPRTWCRWAPAEQFIAGFEKRLEEHVNRFVHAVGQHHLLRRDAKMLGHDALHRLALRIAREIASGNPRQALPAPSGEQAIVFSLKSSRSASRLPSGG